MAIQATTTLQTAGQAGDPPQVRTCATMEVHQRLLSRDPAYGQARNQIDKLARLYESGAAPAQRSGVTRIPVVVHVVWNTAQQNITDAQVLSQIAVLNHDFRRTNPDAARTPPAFAQLAADARVEFFLASVDPQGAPTTGITRRQTTAASFGADDAVKAQASGGTDAWPAARYLNIWVCPLGGGLLGYAQFPGGPAATDGVVIRHSAFGTIGTAAPPFHLGRSATHEIGHWLNLNHIWGDDGNACSGSDKVADTPNQAGANTGTPAFPHISCHNGPQGDMFMNYMDYVDDPAMVMFSAAQVTRMQACLDGPRAAMGQTASEVDNANGILKAVDASVAPISGNWSHSFEEDEGHVQVFRPSATFPFPPSRSPRTCYHFAPNGELTEHIPSPDDRPHVRLARWSAMGKNRYAYGAEGAVPERVIEIVEATPELLKLRQL